MKKLSPIGLLFVDLMASTFAIIFLVLFVTLLKTSQEVEIATPTNPTKKKSSSYRIQPLTLSWEEGNPHPYLEQVNYKTMFSGYIEVHEEYVSFYKKYNNVAQKIEDEALQKKDNKLIKFLESLDKTKKVHIELYSTKYIYKIYKILKEKNLKWLIENASWEDDKKREKQINKENNLQKTFKKLKRNTQKKVQKTFKKLKKSIQKEIEQNLGSTYDNKIFEYLTQKVYRDKGYDVFYYKDSNKIFLTHADVVKYLYPLLELPTKKESNNWWLLLMLLGMSYYLYKEFTLSAKENYL